MPKPYKKKLLIILSHTGAGGDTQVLLNLLYALPPDKYDVHILTYLPGETHDQFKQFGLVYTFPIDEAKLLRRILRRFFMPLFVRIKRHYGQYLIGRIDPDILYVNTVNEHEFSQAAVQSGKPLIVHIHEMGFVVTQRMRSDWIETLLAEARIIISPARAVSDFYRDVYGIDESKMKVVHETVDDRRLSSQSSQAGIREKLGISKGTLLIGATGSVIYRKGVDLLLRTCALLRDRRPDLPFRMLWLGGNPAIYRKQPYYRALQKTIEREGLAPYFQFLPYTSQVADFYACLDLFVLPSRMEAFPLVVLEALLLETPVVAMDVAGVREVIDAETGYLVRDQSPEGLVEGILYFAESKEQRRKVGQQGRQRVLDHFEAQVQVKKWMEILDNV